MMSAPSEMRCRSMPIPDMTRKVAAEHKRDRQRDHDARAPAEREERDRQHDQERLAQRLQELADGFAHDGGLIGDFAEFDPGGEFARQCA